jgi:carboxymethylenebutenolidase
VSHRPGFGAACQTARQMCHDPDSRPPEPPSDLHPCRPDSEVVAGALRARARLARRQPFQGIRRAGRGALRDRRCHPARHPGPHRLLRAAGEGFAAAGVDAIAIDYFGRQNRVRTPPPGFAPMVAFATTTADDVSLDAAAAADHLRATGRANDRIFIVGFCVGGRIAYLNATADSPIRAAGTVAFYGVLRPWHPGMPSPVDLADTMRGPILGLFGKADEVDPAEQVDAFDRALVSAGVDHEFEVYPGATHGFFDPASQQSAAASEDAWRRVIEFIARPASAAG